MIAHRFRQLVEGWHVSAFVLAGAMHLHSFRSLCAASEAVREGIPTSSLSPRVPQVYMELAR